MWKNYFKIALRNIKRNGAYSFINIAGLAVGMACTILILLLVHHELAFDKFHHNHANLYQGWVNVHLDGALQSWKAVSQPLAEELKSTHHDVKQTTLVDWGGGHLLRAGEKKIIKDGHYVSTSFLEMFQFPLLKGAKETVLDDTYSIVLTASTAKALYGDEDPINKTITFDNAHELKVTGILKDLPANSSFQFSFIVPWQFYVESIQWIKDTQQDWGESSFQVFVELNEGANLAEVNRTIKDVIVKKNSFLKRELFLYPMERWRLYSSFKNGVEDGGFIQYIIGLSAIAIFIIVIACINFMNLSTARSERRAREVGIRKSVGSRRQEIILQFLGESMLIAMFAWFMSIVLVEVALPFYNQLMDTHLSIRFTSPFFWILSVIIVLFSGLIAGSYPAFYLSSFQPAKVLKSQAVFSKGGVTPRKVLVIVQFGFSIVLIISTLILQQQITHIKTRTLGYDRENLLVLNNTEDLNKIYQSFKNELLESGVATSVTKSQSPITGIWSSNLVDWPGKPEDVKAMFTTLRHEYDYNKTMGVKVIEGRDFSEEFKSDTSAIIINKAAVKVMGLEEPLGTKLTVFGNKFEVIGVTDDVMMGDPSRPVDPSFSVLRTDANFITLRLAKQQDVTAAVKKVEDIFKKYNSAYPFEYSFADEDFDKKFTDLGRLNTLINMFALLAMFVTGLGLLGLAAFTAEQRTKEIGIRKVLGASLQGIVLLLSKDFARLVIMAFCIAAPLAWWLMMKFLEQFQYRIALPWWTLLAAGTVTLLLAMSIVSATALRAGRQNPAKSLRSE